MQSVDRLHLFRLLLDRSSCPLVFGLGHRETEQLLDAVVVRLPRRRFFLHRGPHGAAICGCACAKREEPVTSSQAGIMFNVAEWMVVIFSLVLWFVHIPHASVFLTDV